MQKCISSCYTLNYTIYKHFTSNIAEKKANKLYNCSGIQFSLATTEVYILCFCFCIKREKHISSCYTLIIMQYTYILIRFNCMQNKLYNCSEIGQRIIQLYTYSKLYSFMFAMERNYTNFAIAYKYGFFVCYM